ncbi:MAG: glycosyl transferase group 1 [Frankiales bacterium]|nr:glycosyl transferase group 1 [Frankiales bacterium]
MLRSLRRRRPAGENPDDQPPFVGSASYWERRYATGGDSGVGSYDQLAQFKATTLNRFVADHGVASVVELGCGDGNQLALAEYPSYIGLDVAPSAVDRCIAAFRDDPSKSFFRYDPDRFVDRQGTFRCDLALSLDVVFHLVEDAVFERYMHTLFDCGGRFVCVYSSNDEVPDIGHHVRHRHFTPWVEQHRPDWVLVERVPNPHRGRLEGAVSDFWFYAAAR